MSDYQFQIVADADPANQAIDSVTSRLDGIANRAIQSATVVGKKIGDIGKGLGFQLAAQGFDKLKDALGDVSSAALSAGASGAAMGSTFAGPWGAAIGGAIGLTKGLVTGMLDAEKATEQANKALEAQGKAMTASIEAAERKARVISLLADETMRLAAAEKEQAEFEKNQTGARTGQASNVQRLEATIAGLQDRLTELSGRGGLSFATPGFEGGEGEKIEIQRKLRDAQLDLEVATKSYGAALLPIKQAENERKDRIADLEQLLGSQVLTQEESKRALDELNMLYRAGTKTLDEYNAALARQKELRELGNKLLGPGTKQESHRAGITAADERAIAQKNIESMVQAEIDAENRAVKNAMDAADAKIKAEQDWRDAVAKATDEAAKKREDLAEKEKESAEKIADAWATGLGSIGADLANMAMQGEMSFEKLANSLAKLALQIAAMQIGGPYGAALSSFIGGLKLPGFASGGVIYEGGSGGTDSQVVAFRKSPSERVTIQTPGQRMSNPIGGGGAGVVPAVYNVFQNDPREVVSGMGTRAGQTQFVKLNRKFSQRR